MFGANLWANLAMLVTVLFWGISFISIKIAVTEVPPVTLALLRFIIASAVLWGALRLSEPAAKLEKGDRWRMLLAGALGVTLYFYFENSGVKLTTAANASLITSIVPVLSIMLDIVIYKTKVSALQWVAIAASLVGTYLSVTANGQMALSSDTFVGNLLVLGAMVCWAIYTLMSKSLARYSGLALTTYQTLLGTLLLAPLSLVERDQWSLFSLTAFGHIVFLAVCCSALCYFLYMYALQRLDVTITTLYLNVVPVVGVLCGCLFLDESVLPVQIAGGAMVILSIFLVNWEKSRGAVPAEPVRETGLTMQEGVAEKS
ncbi:DMT family transporter [Heliomicrobium gestii]|uniref:DMT family transporter n=1 Tax=Heliomicrobium gestii TaxID=2699 RepID=UPI001F397AC7|nr:DMT family transporter [Heliomicrobium gestii]MBM7868336.1 drug/metabolite transporter (DMT)-like permease [Heliomicrobium gestii]